MPSRDYPACSVHAVTMHFPHRHCICRSCEAEQNDASAVRWSNETYAETAIQAGGVLVIRKAVLNES